MIDHRRYVHNLGSYFCEINASENEKTRNKQACFSCDHNCDDQSYFHIILRIVQIYDK